MSYHSVVDAVNGSLSLDCSVCAACRTVEATIQGVRGILVAVVSARTCYRLRPWLAIRRRLRTSVCQADPKPDRAGIDLDRRPMAVGV
jgi:hypothetical protein